MKNISLTAKALIVAVAFAGLAVLVVGGVNWNVQDYGRFLALAVISILASRLKVSFPGLDGSMSVNLPFILIAAVALTAPEAMLIAGLSTLAQCMPGAGKRQQPVQILFNVCTMINSVGLAALTLHQAAVHTQAAKSVLVVLAAAAYFLANTLPVAAIIALTSHRRLAGVWFELAELSFPYFVLGAGVAAVVATATMYVGWRGPLVALPLMYGVYRSYRRYFRQPARRMVPQEAMAGSAAD